MRSWFCLWRGNDSVGGATVTLLDRLHRASIYALIAGTPDGIRASIQTRDGNTLSTTFVRSADAEMWLQSAAMLLFPDSPFARRERALS